MHKIKIFLEKNKFVFFIFYFLLFAYLFRISNNEKGLELIADEISKDLDY